MDLYNEPRTNFRVNIHMISDRAEGTANDQTKVD